MESRADAHIPAHAVPDVEPIKDAGKDLDAHIADTGPGYVYDGPVFTLEAGTTWHSLYRDYFGNLAVAGCAGDGVCHGSPTQHGAVLSSFVCPSGDAAAACYLGMTLHDGGGAGLVLASTSFANDPLSQVLCNTHGGGAMPYPWGAAARESYFDGCNYAFTQIDLERIARWVEAGAPNN